MQTLLKEIKDCTICLRHLAHGVNPVISAGQKSKIAIIGQAPGRIVHESGIPWDDKSGERLRSWLGIVDETFYDSDSFALIPMGFCYPGTGKSGDLAPRPECAPKWHAPVMSELSHLELIVLIGNYAQKYYLKKALQKNLTETVKHYETYLPDFFPLPHPSLRNNIWLKKNPWFETSVIPSLQSRVKQILGN
ncbi:MAG: uracil-DNA glycosylase family protein [Bacteroidota bacterium]